MILQGKVALVTGGASELVEQPRSHSVLLEPKLSDIRSVEGEETADLIRETGGMLVREIRCIE